MSYGPLYIQYRHERWFFFTLPIFAIFVRAILIAFAFHDGLAQLVVLLIVEVALLGATAALRPHETHGGDVYATTLAIVRVIVAAAFFTFVERFQVKAIPRVAVGLVIAVILSLTVVLAFFNMLANFGLQELWREKMRWRVGTKLSSSLKLGGRSPKSSLSMGEKGSQDKLSSFSSQPNLLMVTDRPRNPTPLQHVPLDPSINQPYPEITPTQTSSSFSPPQSAAFTQESYASSSSASTSLAPTPHTVDSGFMSNASGSTTLGSLLPRRPSYEGLGLDRLSPRLDLESGSGVHESSDSPATTHFSSAPSTPLSHSTDARRDSSYRTSWGPSTLPTTPEIVESAPGHDRH